MQSNDPEKVVTLRPPRRATAPTMNRAGRIWRGLVSWRRARRRGPIGRVHGDFDDRTLNDIGLTRGDLLRTIRRTDLPF